MQGMCVSESCCEGIDNTTILLNVTMSKLRFIEAWPGREDSLGAARLGSGSVLQWWGEPEAPGIMVDLQVPQECRIVAHRFEIISGLQ